MTPIERAARALHGILGASAEWTPEVRALYETYARAVIESLRQAFNGIDPDDPRFPEATYCDRCMQGGHFRGSGYIATIWNDGIDAILDTAGEQDSPAAQE